MALARTHLVQRRKRPVFQRQDSNKDLILAGVWRRPRGLHNKVRLHRKGHQVVPSIGFRSARVARGLHKSGLALAYVSCLSDFSSLTPQRYCIVFASTLGSYKRLGLYAAAQQRNFKVLGIKDLGAAISRLTKVKVKQSKKESSSIKEVEKKASVDSSSDKPVSAEKKAPKLRASKKPREVSA